MLLVEGATVRFGDLTALAGIDLQVREGERLTVLGPSGSGKSTLLRAVAGLERLAGGRISWAGQELEAVPAHRRPFGLMFQDYVLFPHRDVAGNVAFGLQLRGDERQAVRRRVDEVLEMVGLPGYGPRRVNELSGGEQQRVALARALAPEPQLLMLDEPLGALDRALRERLLGELSDLFERLSLTILYVTHDQEEALALGDRVAVVRAGRIETVLPPEELWHDPPSEFIARFLGFANLLEVSLDGEGKVLTPWGPLELDGPPASRRRSLLLIPPDALCLDAGGPIHARVESRTFRGERAVLRLAPRQGPQLEMSVDGLSRSAVGDELRVALVPSRLRLLPAEQSDSGDARLGA